MMMMMMMMFLFVCAWPSCKSATLTSSFELRKSWLPFVGRVCRWMAACFFKKILGTRIEWRKNLFISARSSSSTSSRLFDQFWPTSSSEKAQSRMFTELDREKLFVSYWSFPNIVELDHLPFLIECSPIVGSLNDQQLLSLPVQLASPHTQARVIFKLNHRSPVTVIVYGLFSQWISILRRWMIGNY